MITVLLVTHLIIVVALVGVVLLQRSEGGGLGIGGGGGFMSARGTANVLTRTTAILAALFFITSLALSILPRFIDGGMTLSGASAPTAAGDASKLAPITGGDKGILGVLKPQAAPSTVPGPQVPTGPTLETPAADAPKAAAPAAETPAKPAQ